MALVTTLIFDPTTGLAIGTGTYGYEPTLGPNEAVCTSAQFASPKQWKLVGGAIVAATAADLAPTQAQLAASLVVAATGASNAVTNTIAASATHLAGYQSFANMARAAVASGVANGVPTIASDLAAVNAAASALGLTAAAFCALVLEMDGASGQNLAVLLALEAAAMSAKTAAQLETALTTFEASLGVLIAALNGAGLTITVAAPAAIVIPGINA